MYSVMVKTHIDLFSGVGGFALAAQWAGFRTEVFCEKDEFCQEVLKARFGAITDAKGIRRGANKPRIITKQNKKPILIPDIRDFDGTRWQGATLLTGGFPCQPFSCAGKRLGKADDRYLWPEMFRVIREARPSWVLAENVTGIINMELDQVCSDLESEGYYNFTDNQGRKIIIPLVIPACAVNAPHQRKRVWIIAYQPSKRLEGPMREKQSRIRRRSLSQDRRQQELWNQDWIKVATCLCRVDDGVPRRVDRLKALGNAIVPQVAYEIIRNLTKVR